MSQKIKIMLIEDDEAIREMYRLKFEASNIKVTIAKDGPEGLRTAKRLKPDILLLDLKIPEIGGEDVLEALQTTTDWGKGMKVMVLSNINRSVAPKKLHKLHIDKYFIKAHLTPSQVIREVKKLLKQIDKGL